MAETGTLTYEDLASFPDDGLRREIIDGILYVSPSPNTRHQDICLGLALAFRLHLKAHGGGRVFIAPLDVVLSPHDVVEPDVLVVLESRQGVITKANIQGAPSLAIEVLSDPRIDRVRKRDLYARFGVPEYWIVDPDGDRVEIYRHDGARYGKPEIYEPGDELRFAPLPGFAVDLTELFARDDES